LYVVIIGKGRELFEKKTVFSKIFQKGSRSVVPEMIRVGDGETVGISVVELGSDIEQTGEASLCWRKRSLGGTLCHLRAHMET
jgi:hypothetical protein